MRFFTPQLYCEFNSAVDEVADRAAVAWNRAVEDYHRHLNAVAPSLPPQVKELAEACLHDAVLVGMQQATMSPWPIGAAPALPPSGIAEAAVMTLRQGNVLHTLVYFLCERVREVSPPPQWPFPPSPKRWLYDEIDVCGDSLVHRILFSDGTEYEIRFLSVLVSSGDYVSQGVVFNDMMVTPQHGSGTQALG